MADQQTLGHVALDAGADLVSGHHAHHPLEGSPGQPSRSALAHVVPDLAGCRGRTLRALLVRCLSNDGTLPRLSAVPGSLRGPGPRGRCPARAGAEGRPTPARTVLPLWDP